MNYWFFPEVLSASEYQNALEQYVLALAADGIPNLSRAQDQQQIVELVRRLAPDASPENILAKAEHFWRIGHEVHVEDYIILRTFSGNYMLGEVMGMYRQESLDGRLHHLWPMKWHATEIAANKVPKLALYNNRSGIVEIADEEVLAPFKTLIPALRKPAATFFKWLGMVILVAELIYFWPRG